MRVAVTVWKFTGRGIDCGDAAAAWVAKYLETPLRLVRFDPSVPRDCSAEWTPGTRAVTEFSDGFPILVISRASLADLNSRAAAGAAHGAVPAQRRHRWRRCL